MTPSNAVSEVLSTDLSSLLSVKEAEPLTERKAPRPIERSIGVSALHCSSPFMLRNAKVGISSSKGYLQRRMQNRWCNRGRN